MYMYIVYLMYIFMCAYNINETKLNETKLLFSIIKYNQK